MIYYLDADGRGYEAVEHLVQAKLITVFPCQSFPDFEDACLKLIPKVGPDDLIILDTISALANTTRGDFKLGTDITANIWDKRDKWFGDKTGQLNYEAAQQMIMRRLRNFEARSARMIIISHEREQLNEFTGMKSRGPDLNPGFFGTLFPFASDMFRLGVMMANEMAEDGTVKIAAGTRVLYLKMSEEQICKARVAIEVAQKLPNGILNPTLTKLYGVLNKKPSKLVLYGPPGAGKTTLACSDAEEAYQRVNVQQHKKKEAK